MGAPAWVVTAVSPSADYSLYLTFADGTKRVYNAAPLLEKPLFASFRNPAFFMTARAECGTVVWDDDIDSAPEHLYECSTVIE